MTIAPNPAPPAALLDISIDPAQVGTPRRAASPGTGGSKLWSDDGFTFRDVLDLINPLQHIPIVSTFYRAITGDELSPAARIAGGTLFGGPIGLVAAVANTTVQAFSGRDIGETLFASAFGESNNGEDAVLTVDPASSNETQLAASDSRGDGLPISLLPSRPTDQTAAAHTPETAPYLAPHPARSTQAAGSASEPLPRTIAVAKKPQPEPLSSTTASMPSSLLAMANAGIPGQPDGPISALLQARAAVPSSGRIPGLGSIVSNRVEPPVHAAAVSPTNLVQAQNLALEATACATLPVGFAANRHGFQSDSCCRRCRFQPASFDHLHSAVGSPRPVSIQFLGASRDDGRARQV